MWIWGSKTGAIVNHLWEKREHGYAGYGLGLNNPAFQAVKDVGPLPAGKYDIGAPFSHPDLGPYVLRLQPRPENEMHGRSEFLIHGDRIGSTAREASHGCIILSRKQREEIWTSGDHELLVIPL